MRYAGSAADKHGGYAGCVIRAHYVDCGGNAAAEEKRHPLWSRNMTGLKHIRGILYESYDSEGNVGFDDGEDSSQPHQNSQQPQALRQKKKGRKKKQAEVVPTPEPHTPAVPEMSKEAREAALTEEADVAELTCKECGVKKSSVKSMKTHIKMVHLRAGKFR